MRGLNGDPLTEPRFDGHPDVLSVEEGVYTDNQPGPTNREVLTKTRWISSIEAKLIRQAEEARWAALCGPVTVRHTEPKRKNQS